MKREDKHQNGGKSMLLSKVNFAKYTVPKTKAEKLKGGDSDFIITEECVDM